MGVLEEPVLADAPVWEPSTVSQISEAEPAGDSLSRECKLTIISYCDQIRQAAKDQDRARACAALCKLHVLVPRGVCKAKAALELGVWDALIEVLLEAPPAPLADSVLSTMTTLMSSPHEPLHIAWPYLRKAAMAVLQERVLACLAAQMLSRGSDGRASAHVARLVRCLCQFVLPNHEVHLQDSGILEALISDIQTNTLDNAAECAATCLTLASTTPGLMMELVAGKRMSEEDARVAAEMSHVWRRATNQSRAPVPAYTGLNLLSALCELYQSSIQTSPDRPVIPNTKTSLRPADAAGYLLGVLQLQPWVKHSDIMSRPVAQKAILEAVLKSPAIGCLLSYLVVDSGNLRHELGGVCEKVVNVLQAAGQVAAEEVARGQQGLAGLKEELKALKAKLAEAYDVGRHEEPWALAVAARAREVAETGRELQSAVNSVQRQITLTDSNVNYLTDWFQANTRMHTGQHVSKVRRTPPRLDLLEATLRDLKQLITPGEIIAGSDKKVDQQLWQLRTALEDTMLLGGAIPAAVKLHHAAEGALSVLGQMAVFVRDMRVPEHLTGRCKQVLAAVQMCNPTVDKLHMRLKLGISQAEKRAGQLRRMFAVNRPRGHELQATVDEACEVAETLASLTLCSELTTSVRKGLREHEKLVDRLVSGLQQASQAAYTALHDSPPQPSANGNTTTSQHDNTSSHTATAATPRSSKSRAASSPILTAMLRDIIPTLAQTLDSLVTADTTASHSTTDPQSTATHSSGQKRSGHRSTARGQEHDAPHGAMAAVLLGVDPSELLSLAQTELQLHNLSSTLSHIETRYTAWRDAANQAWAAFCEDRVAAQLATILPSSLLSQTAYAVRSMGILTHPEYHMLHDLIDTPDSWAEVLPRLYYTQLAIQAQWQTMGEVGVLNVEAGADMVTHDRVVMAAKGVGHEASVVGVERAGVAPSVVTTTRPAARRPKSAGALLRADAKSRAQVFASSYDLIVHTMSPCKGHPSHLSLISTKQSSAVIPGLSDSDVERMSLEQQCDAVLSVVTTALTDTLGGGTTQDDADQDGADEGSSASDAGDSLGLFLTYETARKVRSDLQRQRHHTRQLAAEVSEVTRLFDTLSRVASRLRVCSRRACLLPCMANAPWDALDPATLRKWMPSLMGMFATGLSRRKDQPAILQAICRAAEQGCTYREDFHRVYAASGLVERIGQLIAGPEASLQGTSGAQTTISISRYGVDPSAIARPSAKTAQSQADACVALATISRHHPEAIELVADRHPDNAWLRSAVHLTSDHSLPRAIRISGALLLACIVSGGDTRASGALTASAHAARDAALSEGAFGALIDLMDSDHREPDPRCAKVATVNALVSLALSDPSREHLHTLTAQQHTTPSTSFPHKPSRPRDAQSPRPDSAKVTQAVQGAATLFPALSTPDAVLKRVLLALWSAPKQLHKLMSSSNTKQGRYVDAEIVRPLTALSLHCTRQLSYMADEEPLARQMLQALGVASRINTTFLQAIKDADLHHALLELKDRLPRATRQDR